VIWGRLGLDRSVSDGVNCRGFSAGENGGFTKVSTGGTEARLWSPDGVRAQQGAAPDRARVL